MSLQSHFSQIAAPYLTHKPPLYVALSGGRDSVVLLYCAKKFAKTHDLPLVALHVNHHLQAVSDDWAVFVEQLARQWEVECQVLDVYLQHSNEQTARNARYDALFGAMPTGAVLLLGHHADDQAETVLLRLINGTSVRGLGAMPIYCTRLIADLPDAQTGQQTQKTAIQTTTTKKIGLLRPFLQVRRTEITQFARAHSLPFVDDPTNQLGGATDSSNARAQLRALLPHLAQLNPKAIDNIARTAFLCQEASAMVAYNTQNALTNLTAWGVNLHKNDKIVHATLDDGSDVDASAAPQIVLNIKGLNQLSAPLQAAVLNAFIAQNAHFAPSFATTHAVLNLCQRQNPDHQTQIVWENAVLCRHRDFLYRYRSDVWAVLQNTCACDYHREQLAWQQQRGALVLRAFGSAWRVAAIDDNSNGHHSSIDLSADVAAKLVLRDRIALEATNHIMPIRLKKTRAQALGVPPWLRRWLWMNGGGAILSLFCRF